MTPLRDRQLQGSIAASIIEHEPPTIAMSRFNPTLVPASTEFVTLCRSQVIWLNDGLGAARSAVYLTQEMDNGMQQLIPVVVYPEGAAAPKGEGNLMAHPKGGQGEGEGKGLRLPAAGGDIIVEDPQGVEEADFRERYLRHRRQIALPLIHEDVVLGLLVTGREDREWSTGEWMQIERAATTLTLACAIDQRQGQYKQRLGQQQQQQQRHRDRLDDLLHQLRNPVATIGTFGKLLLKRLSSRLGEESIGDRRIAENIIRESDRLGELLQAFDWYLEEMGEESSLRGVAALPQASSDPGSLLPATEAIAQPFPLQEVLVPLLDGAQEVAQERGIEWLTRVPGNLPQAIGDRSALREALSNLIDNALKYTPTGGTVAVRVAVDDRLGISIEDSGPGIPGGDRERIFQRHYRGVQARGDIPGSGLGLAIAKELVEQMAGEIELVSPLSQSGGTRFTIWLDYQQ